MTNSIHSEKKLIECLAILPNGLKAHIYGWKELSEVTDLVLCFPGLPNYPGKEFFASFPENLRHLTYVVVYYYGYWFSDGKLGVETSANSIIDSVAGLLSGKSLDAFSGEKILTSVQKVSLLSYSFGANPLARALPLLTSYADQIDQIFFIAPLGLVHKDQLPKVNTEKFYSYNQQFVNFLISGYNNILRLQSSEEWLDFFQGKNEKSLAPFPPPAFTSKINLYYGADDKVIEKEFVDAFIKLISPNKVKIIENVGHSKSLIIKALSDNITYQ